MMRDLQGNMEMERKQKNTIPEAAVWPLIPSSALKQHFFEREIGWNFKTGNKVIIEPCAVLANDKYPIRREYELEDPVIRKGAPIGVHAIVSSASDRGRIDS